MLALGGNTQNGLYNVRVSAFDRIPDNADFNTVPMQWFIGRPLNPRIGSFDIKSFNEMRPGLILWVIIDLAMVAKQYSTLGRVTDSLVLVVAFHTWYVFDAEFNEVRTPGFRSSAEFRFATNALRDRSRS